MTGDVVLSRHRDDVRDGREEAAPPGAAPGQPRLWAGVPSAKAAPSLVSLGFGLAELDPW